MEINVSRKYYKELEEIYEQIKGIDSEYLHDGLGADSLEDFVLESAMYGAQEILRRVRSEKG